MVYKRLYYSKLLQQGANWGGWNPFGARSVAASESPVRLNNIRDRGNLEGEDSEFNQRQRK